MVLALSCARYQSLPLSGCFLHSTSEDNITLLKNSPIKIFVDHLQRRNFFWLNNFKLKISRGEFFQNYGTLQLSKISPWKADKFIAKTNLHV